MHGTCIKINDLSSFFKYYHPGIGVLNQAILHSWWPDFNLKVTVLILKLTGEYNTFETCWKNIVLQFCHIFCVNCLHIFIP